jgi:phosphate transport system permease protein
VDKVARSNLGIGRRIVARLRFSSEIAIETLVRLSGISAIVFVLLVFLFLLREGMPAFFSVSLSDLFGQKWYPTFGLFGMAPLILGSLIVTIGAIVIALPLGVATAVFMRELAPPWLRDLLKPLIEVLAGIPSVVLGFLGMVAVAPLLREYLGLPTGLSAFAGSLMLAYMALPTIISISDDAIDAVPKSYRDASLALGANQWQTISRVVLPAARQGVLIAVMLGIGRAIGETMAVLMVTGNAAQMPSGLLAFFEPVRTMTATIAAEMGEVANGSTHYHVLFALGIVLFLITFLINALASALVIRGGPRRGGHLLG